MISRAALLWMLLALGAGLGLFVVKYEVQAMEERLVAINRQTVEDIESLRVLKAEWSYLNQPARLERLARRLLDLKPVAADQSVSIAQIPMRPEIGGDDAAPPAETPRKGDRPPPLLARWQAAP